MEIIKKKGDKITWREQPLVYKGYEIIDNENIHIIFDDRIVNFVTSDTEINEVICNTVEEIINVLS
jgi:hypothetical protein